MSDHMSNDEIRRQLREADGLHREAMPRYDEALKRTFGDDATPAAAKAELVGVPRRRLLTLGGSTILGAAVLAACTKTGQPKEQLAQTGTTPTTGKEGKSENPSSFTTDLTLLRTAQSIEVLAIDVYQKALDSGLLTTTAVADAARLFQSQHRDHAQLLSRTTRDLGGEPYDQANPALLKELEPTIGALDSQAAVVTLAQTLENVAAETYVYAAGVLTTEELRAAIMSIGAVESRHVTVLIGAKTADPLTQVPFAFIKTADAVKVPSDATNAVGSGPVPSNQPTTTTTQATTTTKAGGTGTTVAGGTGTTAVRS